MDNFWFVFATLGEMNMRDILAECQKQGWVPILHVRCHDGKVMVPCFHDQDVAIKFAKRNLIKGQLFGSAKLPPEDMERLRKDWVEKRGWIIEEMSHPRLVKDLGEIGVEVHEYSEKPDVYGTWGKRIDTTKPISVL